MDWTDYIFNFCGQFPLLPGYGVMISQPQLDELMDCSGGSPTKMIRNLMMVYFKPSTLAQSSCFGSRKYPALDKFVISACLSKCLIVFA